MAKIKLDLHDIFNHGRAIDTELNRVIEEAVAKRIPLVEIIPGKGSGQLKKHVLRFLAQPRIKNLYPVRDFNMPFFKIKHSFAYITYSLPIYDI